MAKEFLSQNGIPFEARDVSADPANIQSLAAATGGFLGVPVIIIDGEVIRGFDRGRISRLLGLDP